MTVKGFVDTSVLVYSRDASEPGKQQAAMAWLGVLWRLRAGALSFQVPQEYYVMVTRKLRPVQHRSGRHPRRARLDPVSCRADIDSGAAGQPPVDLFGARPQWL
jgi:hypothetical protein